MFEWQSDYSVGIKSIDAQHQNLFAIGRELHTAMLGGQGKTALARTLSRLADYTEVHFAHEERLMRQCAYPGLTAHKAEHDALTKQVKQLQADYQAGKATLTIEVLVFLKDWLDKHIKGSDLKYSPALRDKVA